MTDRASSVAARIIGRRIRAFRLASNLTQAELARKSETDSSQVSRWEKGRKAPNLDSLRKIAKALDVSLDDIAGDATGTGAAA